MLRGFKSIHFWHANVEQHDIRGRFAEQRQQLASARSFADEFDGKAAGAILEKIPHAASGGRFIIRYDDFQSLRMCHRSALTYGIVICTSYSLSPTRACKVASASKCRASLSLILPRAILFPAWWLPSLR